MTKLKKPVKRVSYAMIREAGKMRDIVITLRPPNIIGFRAAGCRREYQLTAESCYILAVRADVEAKRKERLKGKKRKAKRGWI